MDEHALRVLEFPKVLGLLAAETAFSQGRELALALVPETDFDRVLGLQRQTAEMLRLSGMGIDVPFGGARDIREHVHAAAIDQILGPSELNEAALALRSAQRARSVVLRVAGHAPHLAEIAEGVGDLRAFTEAVEQAISGSSEVLDAASEVLANVRRELRLAQERLDQRAQAALADAIRRGIAQEALLTERNGRKVVPIRAEARGQLGGIVHDVSSSGATLFIEPAALVEAGNAVRELALAEEREIRRVLQRLTALLGARAEVATASMAALAHLDLLSAKARLGVRMKAGLPRPADPAGWLRREGTSVVDRGRHPLLRGTVVPIDAGTAGAGTGLLITGPNTGGKTVALKTLGLLTLMAQAGLPVPCADTSAFVVYERIYADIGDEQSIEQSLSTFSSHMRNIIGILERAERGTLVLLDELGAGTDPEEGAALARAILEALLDRGCTVVATTHHGELKAFAHSDPRLRNASVEFDLETLSPTYHVTIGIPGQSNAIAIARRLGITESIVESARANLSAEHFELEELLAEIREQRTAAGEARRREETARREAEELRHALAERRERIEHERGEILAAATREAEDVLAEARRELDRLRRRPPQPALDLPAEAEALTAAEERVAAVARRERSRRRQAAPVVDPGEVRPGDLLHVRGMPQAGEALGPVGEDGRVEAQFGALRMKISVDRIARVERVERRPIAPGVVSVPQGPPVALELDLRGLRAEEALQRCESHLDGAFRAGLPYVRVIHGKGTGVLRAAVREALRHHPLVRSYETAAANEGGEGVTIAVLAG